MGFGAIEDEGSIGLCCRRMAVATLGLMGDQGSSFWAA